MKKIIFVLLIILCLTGCSSKMHTKNMFYMDTIINIKLYDVDSNVANQAFEDIDKIYDSYQKLTDRYNPDSELYKINNADYEILTIDSKLYNLIELSKKYYVMSKGLFNINIGSLVDIWEKGKNNNALPTGKELKGINTDINQIKLLENNQIKNNYANIDLGGITKGYVTEEVANYLKRKGITKYVINAGGNVVTGDHYDDAKYKIGVQSPNDSSIFIVLNINNKAIVTSGSYERYYEIEGVKYSHIINPITKYPSDKMKSVTVICDSSTLGDYLSTTLFLMDVERGQTFIKDYDVEVIWYLNDNTIVKTEGISEYEQA